MNKIKENWRPLLVMATVVWAVFSYVPVINELGSDEGYPLILAPFVIAMTIYFLFPKRRDQ